tara:strand:- start:63 stop:467 length:405 start_codon:yes stop_codon:yes gene_type:complete
MIKFKKKNMKEVNLIPMINIVFLLLIFFMLTGTVQKKQTQEVDRIYSKFSVSSQQTENKIILIVLKKEDLLFLNNKEININLLNKELSTLDTKSKVFFDIDKQSRVKIFNRILKTLRDLNFSKVFIKTIYKNEQ